MRAGDVIGDRFEVQRLAGSGGMSSVYLATDATTAAPVALKLLTGVGDRDAERFNREARLLAELRHPRIVRYVAHGITAAGRCWLAMEWLDGETLSDRLRRGALTVDETLTLAAGVAAALAGAHARGVVHRDIKPGNLFLVGHDVSRLKVLDFGLARVVDASRAFSREGVMLGTPGYVAPEQARGARDVGPAADIFALGCVMFECLTGRPAFAGEHLMALLAKILLEEPPRAGDLLRDVPAAVDELITRMMSKAADERPADGARLVGVIEALRGGAGGSGGSDAGVRTPSGKHKPRALTRDERRLVSVVLAGRAIAADTATADTLTVEEEGVSMLRLHSAVRSMGVRLERLADGSLVAALEGQGHASDQAARAARLALALRAQMPGVPMVLATGRGVLAGRLPVGDVIDGAVGLLRADARAAEARAAAAHARAVTPLATPALVATPEEIEALLAPRAVRVDAVTAGLLDASFEVAVDELGFVLRGERKTGEVSRRLLGRPTPCVGRERELAVLEGLWEECVAESMARVVLVTAPAGMGKTRLRGELLRRLRERGRPAEPWVARGDVMSAGSSFAMLAQLARAALGVSDADPPEARRDAVLAAVPEAVAAADVERVSQFLAELCGVPLGDESAPLLRAARRDPVVLGDQMRRAFDDLLVAECARRPVMLVLEDLQWGDLATVRALDGSLRACAERPLLLLALARPEVHDQFPRLWGERAMQEVRLGELSRRAAERLVRHVLGERVRADVVERLVRDAGGHAFFLEELIRAEAERGASGFTPAPAPPTVLATLGARLEALPAELRRVLRAAAVFGERFELGGLRLLLGAGSEAAEAETRAQLLELVEREILARAADAREQPELEPAQPEPAWSFRHALVREAAYAMLTEVDRGLGHRLAAEYLERRGGAAVDPLIVAEHLERGGSGERAAPHYARAAELALTGNDLAAALARAKRALACGAIGELEARVQLTRAEAHYWRGEHGEARPAAETAMRLHARGGAAWHVAAGVVAAAAGNLGERERLEALAVEVLAAPAAPDAEAARAASLARIATYLIFAGSFTLADRALAEARDRLDALSLGDPAGDPGAAGWIASARGIRALGSDSGEALEQLQASIDCFDRAGDVRNGSLNRINAAFAAVELGAYEEAEAMLRRALEPAERMGLLNVVALARNNLGLVLCHRGALAEAAANEREALALFEAQGDLRLVASSHGYLALVQLAAGALDEAAESAARAIALSEAYPPARAFLLAVQASVCLARGDAGGAIVSAGEASALLERLGGVDEGEGYIRLAWARALAAVGREADAAQALRAAHERLLVRAAQISHPAWREAFLERVPENRETRRLAAALPPA